MFCAEYNFVGDADVDSSVSLAPKFCEFVDDLIIMVATGLESLKNWEKSETF